MAERCWLLALSCVSPARASCTFRTRVRRLMSHGGVLCKCFDSSSTMFSKCIWFQHINAVHQPAVTQGRMQTRQRAHKAEFTQGRRHTRKKGRSAVKVLRELKTCRCIGVYNENAVPMTTQRRLQITVAQCRRSSGGPRFSRPMAYPCR